MKLRSPWYSAISAICCLPHRPIILLCTLILLLGCVGPKYPAPEEEARASLALRAAEDRFGVIRDQEIQNYLYYLSARLTSGLARVEKRCDGCTLTLLDTDAPLAYSPGSGKIVISRGLMGRLRNEAELAFVVAHEMAHQILDHHSQLQGIAVEARADLEQDADHFAVGMLALAGYDPRFAPSALMHAYGRLSPDGSAVGYPELYARESKLEDEIMDAKWTPPGTIDRREFQKLRRSFSSNR